MVKNELISTKQKKHFNRISLCVFVSTVMMSIGTAFATDQTLFTGIDAAKDVFLDTLVTTADKSIFPIWLGVSFLVLLFNTKPKAAEIAFNSLKMGAGAFFGLNCINIIVNTLTWVIGLINGTE